MRIALFAPIPPTRSGIASYTAALLPWLARRHHVDVFTDDRPGAPTPLPTGAAHRFNAHDFIWRRAREPYDLVVYQLGNSTVHSYMWPYLVRYPGLVVIHDGSLHDERYMHYLSRGDSKGYQAEFAWNDPEHAAAARLCAESPSAPLRFHWRMLRTPVSTARTVAVHNQWLAAQLREEYPEACIDVVRQGMDDPLSPETAVVRAKVRARYGFAATSVVFGAFGWITRPKRIPEIARAMASVAGHLPDARLLLVGSPVDDYDVRADLRAAGVEDRVILTGYVDDAEVPHHLAAIDVCLCLRWPTARETSATWLHAVAAGKATLVTDLLHMQDLPVLTAARLRRRAPTMPLATAAEPRDGGLGGAAPADAAPAATRHGASSGEGSSAPIAVAVDIWNEEQELPAAMLALARDDELRRRIGDAARAWWAAGNTMQHSAKDYERVMAAAVTRPAARCAIPPHLDHDGGRRARRLLAPFGLLPDVLRRADTE